jgi:orotidine-5'-phosphate decarboxylase
MYRSQAEWENGPADDPAGDAYAERLIDVTNEMTAVITKDVRTTDYTKLGLQYVTSNGFGGFKVAMYPLAEVVSDYGTDKGPFEALMTVMAKSDCPLVQAWRLALAERFVDSHAIEVAELTA